MRKRADEVVALGGGEFFFGSHLGMIRKEDPPLRDDGAGGMDNEGGWRSVSGG